MSFGFGFALPAYPLRGGGGNNPFNQSGPTLDLSFAGVVTNVSDPTGYTLNTNFITPQYQIAAEYLIWETGVGLVDKTFSQIITFTRASSATFTGSNGLIQSATTNTPRFDYDPITLAARGILIEEQRTNLLTYSEDFSNAAWSIDGITKSADTTTAPDGSTTADTITEGVASGNHRTYQALSKAASAITYTVSCYLKNNGRNARLSFDSGTATNSAQAGFDLSAGTIVSAAATTGTYSAASATITSVGNGWYRCTVTATTGTETTVRPNVWLLDGTNPNYTGNGASGIFVWGAQLEAGSFATSYIPTVASQVTRSADVASVNTLSPWYNATEGTLYAEASRAALGGNSSAATLFSATNARMQAGNNVGGGGTNEADFYVQNSGDQAWIRFAGAVTANSIFKIAGAYKVNDFAASANGATPLTDTSGTVPSISSLLIGASGSLGGGFFNGHIRRLTYYPRKLSSAELQAITA